jgi:hypothetical protein
MSNLAILWSLRKVSRLRYIKAALVAIGSLLAILSIFYVLAYSFFRQAVLRFFILGSPFMPNMDELPVMTIPLDMIQEIGRAHV